MGGTKRTGEKGLLEIQLSEEKTKGIAGMQLAFYTGR